MSFTRQGGILEGFYRSNGRTYTLAWRIWTFVCPPSPLINCWMTKIHKLRQIVFVPPRYIERLYGGTHTDNNTHASRTSNMMMTIQVHCIYTKLLCIVYDVVVVAATYFFWCGAIYIFWSTRTFIYNWEHIARAGRSTRWLYIYLMRYTRTESYLWSKWLP